MNPAFFSETAKRPIGGVKNFPSGSTILHSSFLLAAGAAFLSLFLAEASAAESKHPNILFITVDDLNGTVPGCMGEDPGSLLRSVYPDPVKRAEIRKKLTPNIDRLAARGRLFTQAFCSVPLCGPSRASLLTGVPSHISGPAGHVRSFRDNSVLKNAVTLPQFLRQNGYFTTGIGKIFHKQRSGREYGKSEVDWPDEKYSWDIWFHTNPRAPHDPADEIPRYSLPPTSYVYYGPTRLPLEKAYDWIYSRHTATLLRTGTATFDCLNDGAKTVTLPKDKPFFVASGIVKPHLPFVAPLEFFEKFPIAEMRVDAKLIQSWKDDLGDIPPLGLQFTALRKKHDDDYNKFVDRAVRMDGPDAESQVIRELIQAYLACVSFADACVGEMLDGLAKGPYADNTVVVLLSDNGFHLGEKLHLSKTDLWDESARVLLLIAEPGMKNPGPASAPVSLQDVYPTVVNIAGFTPPEHVAGHSLTPLLRDPNVAWNYTVLTSFPTGGWTRQTEEAAAKGKIAMNHAIRDGRWTYIHYVDGTQELYDDSNDPDELTNLAGDPRFAEIKVRLGKDIPR